MYFHVDVTSFSFGHASFTPISLTSVDSALREKRDRKRGTERKRQIESNLFCEYFSV